MEIAERERRLREVVLGLAPDVRRALLHVLMAPPERRAEAIGRLYELTDAGSMAELLMDLEEDRPLAFLVADELKGSLLC